VTSIMRGTLGPMEARGKSGARIGVTRRRRSRHRL
jgi:hypothetical protein